MLFFSQRSNHDPIPSLITCSPRITVSHEVPGRCRKPSHTASNSSALERTLCDDHSRSTFRHSWDLLGKVVQLGVLEGSLYHKHEKTYHQLLPAGSRWRLLRIPKGLFKSTNTTDSIPLLKAFIPSQTLMNSVAKLSSSMVALALHRRCYRDLK